MPPPDGRLGTAASRLELGALLLAALGALLFQLRLPARLPSEADHQAAGAHLRAHALPGDVILLHPWWTERARLHAPEGLPVVGHLRSAQDPLTRHPRIWLLSQPDLPGARGEELEAKFLPQREAQGSPLRFGSLSLQLFGNGRYRPLKFTLSERSDQTSVWIEDAAGRRTPCPPDGRNGFRCGGPARVAAGWHEITSEPRRCLFLQPPGGDRKLVVTFPPLPEAPHWSLEAGYLWDRGFHHGPALTPTTIRLRGPQGPPKLDLALPVGLEGVQRATTGRLEPGPYELSVHSSNPELREVCLELLAYGDAP